MTQEESQFLMIPQASSSFLAGGGEMGERIRSFGWSTTPLGSVQQWPQSLLTLVGTSLRSRFPIVIWWNQRHYTMFYNDAYIPFLGKTKHPGWLGRSGKECWKEIWSTIGPMLESVFQTGQPTWSEDLLLVLDRNLPSEEAYFTFSYSAIPGESGTVEGIFCACTETTERVLSERRLRTLRDLSSRASEARSAEEACEIAARLLSGNDADLPFALFYLLDRERTVAHLAALSGLSTRSSAAPASIALSSSARAGTWPLAEVVARGKPVLMTNLVTEFGQLPGGPWPESPDSALVLPLKAPGQNQVTGFLVVGVNPRRILDEPYRDFFNLVAGHAATAVSNARAYEEERKRAEALAELDRAKTLFFSNISHEFRTPLTLMLGPLQDLLSERSLLSNAQHEQIELLRRNALRLLRLVNTLLDFSRLEAGRIEAVYEPVDLAALTADLASNFRSIIEKAGMALRIESPSELPSVYVDQQMWEKIVLNLLSNAFKYTFDGAIIVRLEQRAEAVEVSVQDTGVGIPAEELPHMFERFHRVKGIQGRTYEGTGIGLSLVHELVKLHAGTLRVTSTPGEGSTFTISFPLGSAHLPAERIAARRTLPSTSVSASSYVEEVLGLLDGQKAVSDLLDDIPFMAEGIQPSSALQPAERRERRPAARILFVDDNADMRGYVSRLLEPHYHVQTAADGKAALTAVRSSHPDLVLADIMMPGMDGFELLNALRSDDATSHIPVILLSARAGEEAQIDGLAAGADDYLVKPFSARELLARVEARLEIAVERQRVQESEARFHALAENISQLAWMADETGLIFWYNQRWYDYTGTTLQDMQEWGWQQVHHPEHVQQVMEKIGHSFASGEVWEDTFPLRSKDGRYCWFLSRALPIRDGQGKVIRWFGTHTDITAQKQLEQRKDEFLGVTSHELKTPVTSLKAYTQLLERQFRRAGDEHAVALLARMEAQVNKLALLVEDLLEVTKIESGKLQLHRTSFDYRELVQEIAEDVQRTTGTHTIDVDLLSPVSLTADRERVGQVLTNLLTNAIKYSPQADRVLVRTRQQQGMMITSVQDFGIGIPEAQQPHLFERFYRVEGEQRLTYPGLGLGLYISAEFVKRHGGSIWVESSEGKGSTISFSLPLSSEV